VTGLPNTPSLTTLVSTDEVQLVDVADEVRLVANVPFARGSHDETVTVRVLMIVVVNPCTMVVVLPLTMVVSDEVVVSVVLPKNPSVALMKQNPRSAHTFGGFGAYTNRY